MRACDFYTFCLKDEKKAVALGVVCSIMCAVCSISLMATAASFLTAMGIAAISGTFVNLFISSAAIRLFAISRTLLRYADRLSNHATTFRIITKLRTLIFRVSLKLDSSSQEYLSGRSMRFCMQRDCASAEQLYVRGLLPVLTAFVISFAAVSVIAVYLKTAALPVLVSVILCFVLPIYVSVLAKERFSTEDLTEKHLLNQSVELLINMLNLKACREYARVLSDFISCSEKRLNLIIKTHFQISFIQAVQTLVLQIGVIAAVIAGADSLTDRYCSAPVFMMMLFVFICISEVIMPLSDAFLVISHSSQSLDRICKVISKNENQSVKGSVELLSFSERLTQIRVDNVSFSYNKRVIFEGISLLFSSDKNYLLKGPCGCGKTTLFKLITMLERPCCGQIMLNGRSIDLYSPASVREHFSCCLQNNCMLTGTLREIFTSVKKDAEDDEILSLLETVQLESLSLGEEGLDTWIGTYGLEISGGQARRLSVARALLYQREFLLLDEPTSGIDKAVRAKVMKRILDSRKGVIAISHETDLDDLFDEIIEIGE
ncbi:MAG: amino acid ABC transporter ATP-binding/permease protein [Succinivibrio sp.]